MEKVKKFLTGAWMVKLLKIIGYAVVEVLASVAFINLLKDRIADELVYMVVIVVTVQIAEAIKKLVGEKSVVAKVL